MRERAVLLGLLAGLVAGGLAVALFGNLAWHWLSRDRTETEITTAALTSVQALDRLTVFAAVLTTAATTTDPGFAGWLTARQTLIASGRVDYILDFHALAARDVAWDKASATLTVTLATPRPTRANVDWEHLVRYDAGSLVTAVKGNVGDLERRNAAAIYARFNRDARSPALLTLARDAARTAIVNNFGLPLRAAGIEARVVVRFRDAEV